VSGVAALGLTIVPSEWVGLLGPVPFALGVKGLIGAVRGEDEQERPAVARSALTPADLLFDVVARTTRT
jgi:cadmium resistance protein CadD (predicted permease)